MVKEEDVRFTESTRKERGDANNVNIYSQNIPSVKHYYARAGLARTASPSSLTGITRKKENIRWKHKCDV